MVARWKPVHLGHAAVIRALLRSADQVVLGIGSSNKLDVHNPFSAAETREMLELVLEGSADRATIVDIPDLGTGYLPDADLLRRLVFWIETLDRI